MTSRKSVASQISSDASAQDIDVTVPANQQMVLYHLEVGNESNVDAVQPVWTLECPPATTRMTGHAPVSIDFGPEGWRVPQAAAGDNVQLTIAAAGSGLKSSGILVYKLVTAQS